jgi:hypothetical protein
LEPTLFATVEQAVQYLNDVIDDEQIKFTTHKDILTFRIKRENVEVTIDDTLKDILGFDQNRFTSKNDITASVKLSLTRRINYFQIYSNIGNDIRIGDTQAPLLAMIPYNPKDCSILSERRFEKFHFVNLKSNYIPRIDISIYDDAGELVPFHKDAITSVTLYFRPKV